MTTLISRSGRHLVVWAVALTMMGAILVASQDEARAFVVTKNVTGVEVETEMNSGNAQAGGTGWALVSISVTKSRTQRPLKSVASSISNNASGISLPSRIVFDDVTVPAGGCAITPTQLINHGDGVYTIRFVPAVSNTNCKWKTGDYIYNVIIKDGGGKVLGQGLAKLTV